MSKYTVWLKGTVLREFDTAGEMDSFLADRIFDWTNISQNHLAHMGSDYVELVNERGTSIRLTFTPSNQKSIDFNDSFGEWLPFE